MNHMDNFIQHILMKVKMLEINDCINLTATKLNRSISIEKCENGCNVHEKGVNTKTFKNVSFQELAPLLRILVKMEFSADPKIKVSTLKAKDENSEVKEPKNTEEGSEE